MDNKDIILQQKQMLIEKLKHLQHILFLHMHPL